MSCRIPKPVLPEPLPEGRATTDAFWKELAALPIKPLPRLPEPCEGCAVLHGFYRKHAEELEDQPRDIREAAKVKWDCHEHIQRKGCAGLARLLNPWMFPVFEFEARCRVNRLTAGESADEAAADAVEIGKVPEEARREYLGKVREILGAYLGEDGFLRVEVDVESGTVRLVPLRETEARNR